MSASLMYKPVKPEESLHTEVTACQVRDSFKKLFGDYPIVLTVVDLPAIRTLETLWDGRYENPYTRIAALVEKHPGGVKLWEEY